MTSTNTFALSYEEIRKQAQTIDDLARWFEDNPHAFKGLHASLPHAKLKVKISAANSSKMSRFRETGSLEVKVDVSFKIDTQLHSLLEGTASSTTSSPGLDAEHMVELNNRYTFQLPLKDWPCATAYLVHAFIQSRSFDDDRPWMSDVKFNLDEMLNLHFQGHSLEKLHYLHQDGLLPLNQDEELDMDALAAILFNTFSSTPAIPTDLAT